MKICWRKLLTTILFWLASEISLNFLGLDNLADHGEFTGNKHLVLAQFDTFGHS